MPVYEYRCRGCGERVEVRITGASDRVLCPECGGELLDRLISVPHIVRSARDHDRQRTCCGREERCASPPCEDGGECRRH